MHSGKQPQTTAESTGSVTGDAAQSSNGSDMSGLWAGLQPAYRDMHTGEIHLALASDGTLSSVHTFYGLPEAWIAQRDAQGRALMLQPQVVAGFWRSSRFIEVEATIALPNDALPNDA